MNPATLELARSAKEKLAEMLDGVPEVCGIGIAVLDGGFGVKLNLTQWPETPIPEEIDGVPIKVNIIGEITPL